MTIYDIARMAGVSASTVSRVVNNKPGIKEETGSRYWPCWNNTTIAPTRLQGDL